MVRDENYIVIHGWFINRLGLKGTDLIVYAVLYGFSQDGESEFRGTVDYIADFTGASRRTVIRALQDLEEQGYVKRVERNYKEGKTNGYVCILPSSEETGGGVTKCHPPCDKMSPPVCQNVTPPFIIEDKINNNINNNKKESKKVDNKEDIYKRETYDEILTEYGFAPTVETAVKDFLKYLSLNKHTLTNDTFRRLLDNLSTYEDDEMYSAIYKAIDNHKFMIQPSAELHNAPFGRDKTKYDEIINSTAYNLSEVVKREIWNFIQYKSSRKEPLTNDSLRRLCIKLRFSFLKDDDAGRVKAIQDAIDCGFRTIKVPNLYEGDGK